MPKKMDFSNDLSSSGARGARLTLMRHMLGFTRIEFQSRYGLSASTIQSWEAAKAGGLTKRGARKIMEIMRTEGMVCTIEWLMHGIGNPPQLHNASYCAPEFNLEKAAGQAAENQDIVQELLFFRKLHKNALDIKVNDDGMLPYFSEGEYVAGVCHPLGSLGSINGLNCIVKTHENHLLLRKLRYSLETKTCDLLCINPYTTVEMPTLYQQTLLLVAPVVWHRRR